MSIAARIVALKFKEITMKALFFIALAISVPAWAENPVGCNVESTSSGFDVYQDGRFVNRFSSAQDAIDLKNQLIDGDVCIPVEKESTCAIESNNSGFDVYQDGRFVRRFKNAKGAIELKDILLKGGVCKIKEHSQCNIE